MAGNFSSFRYLGYIIYGYQTIMYENITKLDLS